VTFLLHVENIRYSCGDEGRLQSSDQAGVETETIRRSSQYPQQEELAFR